VLNLQWRYFRGSGQELAIYRWPANGKSLAEQRLAGAVAAPLDATITEMKCGRSHAIQPAAGL
jgi:hypothetical protein